nr:MAG TPA_asm: hypothetical protein [Caudoviricetes sp.]
MKQTCKDCLFLESAIVEIVRLSLQDDNNTIYIICQHFPATFFIGVPSGAPIFIFPIHSRPCP